jgi:hypothetical protein
MPVFQASVKKNLSPGDTYPFMKFSQIVFVCVFFQIFVAAKLRKEPFDVLSVVC